MKRVKFYTTVCLIVAMIVASCPAVFASDVVSYGMTWLFNPIEGVRGYVYASSPHGFIVKDYETYATGLINGNGAVIPPTTKHFSYVSEEGIIDYYDQDTGESGVMDVNGNSIIDAGSYPSVYSLGENRFAVGDIGESGYYVYRVIDRDHNVIIPGEYDYIRAQKLIICSNDDGHFVYDYDGNLISEYPSDGGNAYISVLPADDRYLYSEYNPSLETTITKIIHINGTEIATINGWVYSLSETVLCSTEYTDSDYRYYYYDFDGNVLGSESGEEMWKDGSMYERFTSDGHTAEYRIEYTDNHEVVVDTSGNIVYDNPDRISMWEVVDDRFIIVYADGYHGLYEVDGTPVIAPDYYNDISYCEELDLFAFEKDDQISIAKFTPTEPTVSVTVYGKPVEFDQPPVIKEGRTLVPVRAIAEALGAAVEWAEETQTVTATIGDTVVQLVINSNEMLVNGEVVEIDVPAEIVNSRTLIPVRAISEAFGCQVQWDGDNYRVIID